MLINGVAQESIQISDRAVSYGDGVFETIRLCGGKTIYLDYHLQRLKSGCERLGMSCDLVLLKKEIQQLAHKFEDFGVLKIIVSRGAGGRGYRPGSNTAATRILTLHTLPDYSQFNIQDGIQTFLCQQRLAIQPSLAGIKHLNRLEQVLASQEWPSEDFLEGIMLDLNGNVIEGTKSNLFFVESDRVITPDLTNCGINGVMRKVLLESFGAQSSIKECSLERLQKADEVFVCNSVFGVWPVCSLSNRGEIYNFIPGEISQQAQQIFQTALLEYAD